MRARIARARRLVVLTGPALAPDNAIPAFSDCGTTFGGAEVRAVAAQQPFFEDPVAVWRWYDECRRRLAGVAPGAARRALAEAERRAEAFTLATECVDGLHRRAGSRNVVELRGSVWQTHCTRCGLRSENRDVPIAMPPSCPLCTGLARPGVLWRGEEVPRPLLERCFEALRRCDALVVAGTPGDGQPAVAFIAVARRAGAFVVEVSADPRPGSAADALVIGPPDDVVPDLFAS
ncbi:MAG TPA: Sir2 family NAD-dependent protein deacetylase [bacterium]